MDFSEFGMGWGGGGATVLNEFILMNESLLYRLNIIMYK